MLRLVTPSDAHVTALMQWFPDAASVAVWSPGNSFPFVREAFIREAKLGEVPSFMLVDDAGTALAFGQYYPRAGCCHLSRLIVAPGRRREGLGAELVARLCERGTEALGVSRCSLFVLEHNVAALRLYQRMGFVRAGYPEAIPLPDCLYLVRTLPSTV